MDIIFSGRQTDVPARFREYATGKLSKLEKLDQKTMRVEVELSAERNPRQASQKDRVELTVRSRGPAIRAEAAAEDRLAAFDLALAKLGSRLRRAVDRRKSHHAHGPERQIEFRDQEETPSVPEVPDQATAGSRGSERAGSDSVVPIPMEGDGPLVVRQKFHSSDPITIDQALLEMELVGHDFYLFYDIEQDLPSVVYRRHGYQYGVIRLVGDAASGTDGQPEPARGLASR